MEMFFPLYESPRLIIIDSYIKERDEESWTPGSINHKAKRQI